MISSLLLALLAIVTFQKPPSANSPVIAHPIHISVSDVEFKNGEIKWSTRIYKDDLLLGMYGTTPDLSRLDDRNKIERDILKYLSRNIIIKSGGNMVKWAIDEINTDPEAILITLSSAVTPSSRSSITIQNQVLLDVYRDQKNIVNFTWENGKKNFIFERGNDSAAITF